MKALLTALRDAKRIIANPVKDAKNPHYRNNYASLESVLDAVTGPLTDNGLVLVQTFSNAATPDGHDVEMTTTLWHAESGERLSSTLRLSPAKRDPQGYAGAATYYRRMAIKALLGLAEVDDDGEHATRGTPMPAQRSAPPQPAPAAPAKKAAAPAAPADDDRTLIAAMAAAATMEELQALAERARRLPDDQRADCREAFLRRRDQLTATN